MSGEDQRPVRVRRHLMDPSAPPAPRDHAAETRSVTRVQRWVMSTLMVTTVAHLAVGLIVAAMFLEDPRPGARVGLCLIAGAFGVLAVAGALLIHGRRPWSPWLALGLIPTVVGIVLVQR